jgi:pimeloyl-ACP methyl ester carboxylesterase
VKDLEILHIGPGGDPHVVADRAPAADSPRDGAPAAESPGDGAAGAKPPILLLHGAWHGAWCWERWAAPLASAGFEVFAPSLPGHGESPGDIRSASLPDHLRIIRELIGELPERPILVGHSYGGFITQHLLAEGRYPGAVLIASVPRRYPASVSLRALRRHPLPMARSLLARDLAPMVGTPALVRDGLFGPDTPEQTILECRRRLTGAPLRLFVQMRVKAPRAPVAGTPTAVMAAALDFNFTIAMQRRLAHRLGAGVTVIEGSGHDMQLDVRSEQALAFVKDWIAREVLEARTGRT